MWAFLCTSTVLKWLKVAPQCLHVDFSSLKILLCIRRKKNTGKFSCRFCWWLGFLFVHEVSLPCTFMHIFIENRITEISPTLLTCRRFHSNVSTFMELRSSLVAEALSIWLIFIRILFSMGPCMISKRTKETENYHIAYLYRVSPMCTLSLLLEALEIS